MKNILISLLFILLAGCNSKQSTQRDIESFIVDKLWFDTSQRPIQYYYSSKNGVRYLYKPKDNILSESNAKPPKGYSTTQFFKIIGDSIFLQKKEDYTAKNIIKIKAEILSDTIIGVMEYNMIQITDSYGRQKYISKKN